MVRLLAELVRTPRFPNEELPRLRTDLLRRLDLSRARPQTLALERFRLALYGEHPYGRVLPSDATIAAFTTEAAHDFIRSHACARRAALYVGGRFDNDAVTQAAEEAFGDWEAGSEPAGLAPSPRSERAVHLVDRPGSEQSTIYLGLPVPSPEHPDWVALWVTNALLGGSFYSRITLNLREDKGYTYSPHGVLSTRARDAYWVEIADVATPVTGASLAEIFAEVERLRSEAPSHGELEGAQRYVAGNHLLHFATPGGIIEQFASLDLQGLPEEFAAIFTDRVYAVTPLEVQSIAMKHLRPDEMTIAVVGDAEQIRSQVEPFGRIVTSEAR
jgi:zinc protease